MRECPDCCQSQAGCYPRWVAPRRQVPLSGLLNVDKPAGVTSHDVVDAIRRMSGQRKVGHAGTLDPLATGVLLICLGRATRVAEYVMAGQKRYRATIVLGSTTDTYDADGKIITSGGRADFERVEIEEALDNFLGRIEQVPPMYSAIKRNGRPLYQLAREGETVDRPPRSVEVREFALVDWTSPSLIVEVTCSPGTYVRSLAHDLGQQLGSGAHLAALIRLRSGRFSLEQAVSLERLEEAFQHGQEGEFVIPLDEALLDWPAMVLNADQARRIAQGQAIESSAPACGDGTSLCRAYNLDGEFLAIVEHRTATGRWHPKKVFAEQSQP
jgi:tRNA pseudouridine55 synthase